MARARMLEFWEGLGQTAVRVGRWRLDSMVSSQSWHVSRWSPLSGSAELSMHGSYAPSLNLAPKYLMLFILLQTVLLFYFISISC